MNVVNLVILLVNVVCAVVLEDVVAAVHLDSAGAPAMVGGKKMLSLFSLILCDCIIS